MEITISEAAARLGVSVRQAQRLARAGRLQVVRQIGSSKLVDDIGITQVANGRPGRIWAGNTAWAAVDLLETGRTDRLVGSALSRLRRRLRESGAEEFVRLSGDRAEFWRGTPNRRSVNQLRDELALSGESLLARDAIAAQFGLVAGDSGRIEGYAFTGDWGRLQARFGLEADGEGEVLVHLTRHEPTVGVVSSALDLAERWAPRERSAALRFLDESLSPASARAQPIDSSGRTPKTQRVSRLSMY